MDFIEFLDFSNLKNSVSTDKPSKQTNKNLNKRNNKIKGKNEDTKGNSDDTKDDNNNNVKKVYNMVDKMTTCDDIKRGDYISIIYNPNSIYNYYKGYIGEIIEYNKMGKFAIVCLLGLSHFKTIKLPITHFIKRKNVA